MKTNRNTVVNKKEIKNIDKKLSYIYLECIGCGKKIRCNSNVQVIKCWECVVNRYYIGGIPHKKIKSESSKKPKGWHFLAEFVDSEGNVYHKGVVQPQLKGKREVTDVDNIRKKQAENLKLKKKNKEIKQKKKEEKLLKEYNKKKKLKKKDIENKKNKIKELLG